jgi:hypothetical protein
MVVILSLVVGLSVRRFSAKKPRRSRVYAALGVTTVLLVSAALILSALSLLIPITSQKEESKLGATELWVSIVRAEIEALSLEAPHGNVTLSLMGSCLADTMVMKKGSTKMTVLRPEFEGVSLETTYLDAVLDLYGIDLPLSLYGQTAVPDALSSLLTEITLRDVAFHSPAFSAASMNSQALTIESAGAKLLIKAERAEIPDINSLLRSLPSYFMSIVRGEEIVIEELRLENGSFILEGNVSISFDSATIKDAELNSDDLMGMLNMIPRMLREPRQLIYEAIIPFFQGMLSTVLRDPPSVSGSVLAIRDLELSLSSAIRTGESEIRNMRIG